MIEKIKDLLGRNWRKQPAKKIKTTASLKRPNGTSDFRAVEIAPSVMCCTAATQVTGRSYLLREAPRLLYDADELFV